MIKALREEFWKNVLIPGEANSLNQELEKALRLVDYFEMGELMAHDALDRRESCGGHFREESQTEEGDTKRDDANFTYVSAWEYKENAEPVMHKEELVFENVHLIQRSYK